MNIFHFINHAFVTQEKASIHPFDLGFLRGYGVFDYVQIYEGRPFYLLAHLERLRASAEAIGLTLPMSQEKIVELTHQLIKKNQSIPDAGIRFILTGGYCDKGFLAPSGEMHFTILFHPYEPHPDSYITEGMRVITTKLLRVLPSVKTLEYLPATIAMKKAKSLGFHDAIYLNDKNELLEATTSNFFAFKGNTLITSHCDQIVEGVTRNILLEIAKDEFEIEFRSLHLSEIASCDEAFLCSSVKDVVPLVQIDDIKVGKGIPGPSSLRLRNLFKKHREKVLYESR